MKLLWFPLVKYWIRQSETGHNLNRRQPHYYMIALERTQWKGRNLFMVTFVWVTHALPFYWSILNHVGNSDFKTQKHLLSVALSLFKNYPVLVLGDREFHNTKLAQWGDSRGV